MVIGPSTVSVTSTPTPSSYLATGLKAGTTQVSAQVGAVTSNTVQVVVTP